ncbi:putative uncharacterized protein [Rhodococcus sp. AW25M09]|nr:putative uncharacterized protein [Rhodococcus sp. AW25M09]
MVGPGTDTLFHVRDPNAPDVAADGSVLEMDEHLMVIDDDYTGVVAQGSPPQRRTIPGATITKMSVGPMDNNTYLVVCSATGNSLLIDAANEAERLSLLIDENAPTLSLIVTTHQHDDHWQALADIAGGTDSPTAAHELDAEPLPVTPDRLLADQDTVSVGELTFDVVHLAGHTPGSIALALTEADRGRTHLFTGDSLFPGGVGKTANPADFTHLLDDVTNKLFDRFGDDTVVYPGHGKDTTLGAERPHLAEWRERGW